MVSLGLVLLLEVAGCTSGRGIQQAPPPPTEEAELLQAEAEWNDIQAAVQEKLICHKEQLRNGKNTVHFQSDIGRIGEFFRKYQKSAPDFAWAAKTFLAVRILQDALQQSREALGVLREVTTLAGSPLVAGIAALHAGEILLSDGNEAGIRQLVGTYESRATKDPQIHTALQSLLVRVQLLPGRFFLDIQFESLQGETVKLAQLRGRMVVLTVFNVEAEACRQELVRLAECRGELDPRKVVFLGISVDRERDRLESMLREFRVDFPVGFDGKEWRTPAIQTLAIQTLPSSYVIDPQGKILCAGVRGLQLKELIKEAFRNLEEKGAFPVDRLPEKRGMQASETSL